MITCFQVQQPQTWGNFQQEKSQNLSGKWKQESMIWDKVGCINGCMVKSNLVIYLVPYLFSKTWNWMILGGTGNFFSETLILASPNPQYEKECSFSTWKLQAQNIEHVLSMLCTEIVLNVKTKNNFCTQHVLSLQLSRLNW